MNKPRVILIASSIVPIGFASKIKDSLKKQGFEVADSMPFRAPKIDPINIIITGNSENLE
jgi:hypothetical protein